MGIDAVYYLYLAAAASAASSIIQARAVAVTEELRQTSIRNETRQEELNAQQEEITRRTELQYANADVIAGAGGIDPFGSPSLLVIRRKSLRDTERDIRNLKSNLALQKAQGSLSILASKNRTSAAKISSIFDVASSILGAAAAGAALKKPPVVKKKPGFVGP